MRNTSLILLAMFFSFSQIAFSAAAPNTDLYNFYFSETVAKHFRAGLVAQVEDCRSLNYQPCLNRFDGLKFQTVTTDTAMFLATLAKDYSLGIHPKDQTLGLIHQILDAWDRLSRYSSDQSEFLVAQIHQQNIGQMSNEFSIRQPLIQQMAPSGFLIREDLGPDFDKFASGLLNSAAGDPFQSVNPSSHDMVSVLFGLATAKKYVTDPMVQFKISQLAIQISDYLTSVAFRVKNPKTGTLYSGDTQLAYAQYPLLVGLRYLIEGDSLKPKMANVSSLRLNWKTAALFRLAFTRFNCDENLLPGTLRLKKCDYAQVADLYLLAALASFEDDDKLAAKNLKFFNTIFLNKKRIQKEQSPLLATVAIDFYGLPKSIELALAFQTLQDAPTKALPNTWVKPWKRLFQTPLSFAKSQVLIPSDLGSETGTEFPGTDYLMPFVFSAFHP